MYPSFSRNREKLDVADLVEDLIEAREALRKGGKDVEE